MNLQLVASVLFLAVWAVGCGKYARPFAPESLAPEAVRSLEVNPELQGIKFKWKAPEQDQRGKELKEIDGYKVYRKPVIKDSDIVDRDVEFDLVGTVEDTHLKVLKERREEAFALGKPTHRIKVEDELKKFEYSDVSLEPGKTYLYQIVPFNQGRAEGRVSQLIKVRFRGETSEVTLLPTLSLDELIF